MSWQSDPYWAEASREALAALDEADVVLVPQEFLPLSDRFAPLEFSWGIDLESRRVAYCCAKDDVDKLSVTPSSERQRYRWANEVFVLGALFDWKRASARALKSHLPAWFNRTAAHAAGTITRRRAWEQIGTVYDDDAVPRVLIVGASGMGNVGDDFLSLVIAGLVQRTGQVNVWRSGPDFDPAELKAFSALIVGGGGLIYASRDGSKEWQNLANYLKFGPICQHYSIPVALIGVSDQDHARGIDAHPLALEFARNTIPLFNWVTTRDAPTAALLQRLGAHEPVVSVDLLFAWLRRAHEQLKLLEGAVRRRIGLAGELFNHPVAARLLADPQQLREVVGGHEYEFLVMSDDDLDHAKRAGQVFRAAGAALTVVDLRTEQFEFAVKQIALCRGLVTTRFHGLVLAAITGTPLLALDRADGKKARLLGELRAPTALLDEADASDEALERLKLALQGQMTAMRSRAVLLLTARARLHTRAVKQLLGSAQRQQFHVPAARIAPAPRRKASGVGKLADRLVTRHHVQLCWAASTGATQGYANLGDSLSAVIVSALSGLPVRHTAFRDDTTKLVAVGSIAHAIRSGEAVIWGSGVSIRGGVLARNVAHTDYDVRAVRGGISAAHLRRFGISVPKIYGDPVWLLPSIFDEPVEKVYELGVIPHIQDIQGYGPQAMPPAESVRYQIPAEFADRVTLINTWHDPTWEGVKQTLRRILACKRIVSQSFHGVVIAEAYGIPVLHFRQYTGAGNGLERIDLRRPCTADPRIFEFYEAGPEDHYHMYAQIREEPTDWNDVIATVDRTWKPFAYDASALIESFPLPLAYDPRSGRIPRSDLLNKLKF